MPNSAKHPTLRDVAALAGVSHQTVSRVVNHVPGVTPETRATVEQAIAELGFRPHAIARSMAEGRTRTVACLAPNLTDFTYASNIEGAEYVARRHGYFLLSASYDTDSGGKDRQFEALIDALVGRRRVDGLIVFSPNVDLPVRLLPADFPVVLMGGCPRTDVANLVYLDNRHDAAIATGHLLELGHTRIGQITGPLAEDCAQERNAGYREALGRAGIAWETALTVEGDWSATSGYEALRDLLDRAPEITAVVVQNDRMAVGVIRAAQDAGLAVPAGLSVVGFDDMPLASYFDPPLTTMRQDTLGIGRTCAERLIAILDQGEPAHHPIRLASELVTRGSTAHPAHGASWNSSAGFRPVPAGAEGGELFRYSECMLRANSSYPLQLNSREGSPTMSSKWFKFASLLMVLSMVFVFAACAAPAPAPAAPQVVEKVVTQVVKEVQTQVVEVEKPVVQTQVVEKTIEITQVPVTNMVYNSYQSDPAPRQVDADIVKMFQEKYPNISVTQSTVAHEDFKQAIRAYLTSSRPRM